MKHDFEERKRKRIENARNRAAKSKQDSDKLYKEATKMASVIPMGQPILVGHHSEKADRRYRDKIHNTYGKAFKEMDKAAYYKEKAEIIESNDAIFSDDPAAVEKLTAKLAALKEIQFFMKEANKCIKKKDRESFLKLHFATEQLWQELTNPAQHFKELGFPAYKFSNNGANIRRIEKRIAQLQRQQTKPGTDKTINGVRIYENREANRLQIIFSDKPEAEVRKRLKASGFRWSPTEGAWQRHISNDALYWAEQIAGALTSNQ